MANGQKYKVTEGTISLISLKSPGSIELWGITNYNCGGLRVIQKIEKVINHRN